MFSRKYMFVLFFLTYLLSATAIYAQDNINNIRAITIPMVEKSPVFDGALGDKTWNAGVLMSDFTSISGKAEPVQQTTCRALYDSSYLYLGIKCNEINMSGLMSKARGADSNVWRDDDIEVFLDTTNSRHRFFHLTWNPDSAYAYLKQTAGGGTDGNWNAKCITKTGRVSDGWIIEIAIPFADLGVVPTPGMVWSLNVCRGRQAGTREFSAWNPTLFGFDHPNYFGNAVFGDASGNWNGIKLISWGDLDPVNGLESKNRFVCLIPNKSSTTATFQVTLNELTNGNVSSPISKSVTISAGQTVEVEIPYQASNKNIDGWAVNISSDGKELFSASHDVVIEQSNQQRVWNVKDPLYKELLSNTPPGLQQYGSIYWLHTYRPTIVPPFAREYGIRYSNEEGLKELADEKLLAIVQTDTLDNPFVQKMADKYKFKVLLVPDIKHWTAPDAPKIESASFILDPRSKAVYFKDLKNAINKYRKYIWGIYTGDEMTESCVHQAVALYINHKTDYPYILKVNKEVKNKYGFGIYGMPESTDDTNPYRWIAMRRWVNNELFEWQKEVYQTVHKMAPEIKVISIDPVACHKPVAFDKMAKYFDIATQQLYPPINPNRQQFGFTTKMVSDLTGRPTWPCTHVENYAFSTTLDEVNELLSQVIRNGGKSFHYWLCDEQGNNSPNGFMLATKWGFPERWRALCELNKLNGKMNEVNLPKDPDAAIFYSEDYYQSTSEKVAEYPYIYTNEPEWAYTFFGPVARTWFKFINDNIVENKKTDISKFKAIIVPAAKYERSSVVNKLMKYVSSGGTLIIGDPEAFSTDIKGKVLSDVRAKLIAQSCALSSDQTSMTFSNDCSMPSLRNLTLSVSGLVFKLTPISGSEVMARFPDGSPAVLRNKVGKGSVIVFATNPFTESGIADENWKNFFKALSLELKLKTNRDIWRFRFPEYKTVFQPDPEGTCLTGNYIKFWQDKPMNVQNAKLAGTYSYSLQPDAIEDRGDIKAIGFDNGKLTDRKKAYGTLKTELKPSDFIVSWKTEKPVDITFDLKDSYSVSRLNLWYSDELASLTVKGSADGKTWSDLAYSPKMPMKDKDDILDISLDLNNAYVRYIQLSFGARDPGSFMTLIECEIWGDTIQ